MFVCEEKVYMIVNLESALRLRQYPGAVSWLQAAVAKLDPGKQVSNKKQSRNTQGAHFHLQSLPFREFELRKLCDELWTSTTI